MKKIKEFNEFKEVCKNCILYCTEFLELPDLDESLKVLEELDLKLNSGGLKNDI